jgi:hypothetical protein
MKKKLASIAERRQLLVAQAAQQRETLAKNMQPLENSLAFIDKGLTIVRYIKMHPVLIMGITAIIGILRPARAVKWLSRSWVTSIAMRSLRTWLSIVR